MSREAKGIRSPGAGVKGSCPLPDVDAVNQKSSNRAVRDLDD